MNSKITNINRFLIRVYFGEIKNDNLLENKIQIAINKAYLDFCRTLHEFSKEKEHDDILVDSKLYLKNKILELTKEQKPNQNFYDNWHRQTCDNIIKFFPLTKNYFHYGQAQKWINMTLKYLFVLEVSELNNMLAFLHVPIDNIILDKLKNRQMDYPKFETPWSKIDNYDKYINF